MASAQSAKQTKRRIRSRDCLDGEIMNMHAALSRYCRENQAMRVGTFETRQQREERKEGNRGNGREGES